MKKTKIILGSLGSTALLFTPIIAVASCGSKGDLGETALLADSSTNIKTNSFTQGLLKGVKEGDPKGFAINVKEDNVATQVSTIKESMQRGVKNFVLGSFAMHADIIADKLGSKKPNLIAVDQNKKGTKFKDVASVSAIAQEGAFLAGYLIAEKMHSTDFKQAFNDGKLRFGYIGGYKFSTVTDFYYGLINGMKYYDSLPGNHIDSDKAIEFVSENNGKDSDYFPNTWSPTSDAYQTSWKKLISEKPDVVIGSPENSMKYNKQKTGNKLLWIGTDVDATKQFPKDKGQILLSVRKKLGVGIAELLKNLKKNDNNMEKLSEKQRFYNDGIIGGTIDMTPGIIPQSSIDEIYKPSNPIWKAALNKEKNVVAAV